MPAYDIFFFGALFFLIGVLLASLQLKFWILVIAAVLFLGFLIYGVLNKKKRFFWLGGLSFLVMAGSLYYAGYDLKYKENVNLVFNQKTSFVGAVVTNPKISSDVQEFVVEVKNPFRGRILIKTIIYPRYRYGDLLSLEAIIKPSSQFPKSYAQYLAKEGLSGVASFPRVQIVSTGQGSPIKSFLFDVRNKISESYEKILPPNEAAFLGGLTLGGMQGLTKSFKEAMRLSGTTHLVALSGYNVSLIVVTAMSFFVYFLPRRLSLFLATAVVLGFVFMTGAEASVVRAAIMGFLVLLAKEIGRLYDFRNAIIFAGFLMVLQNPKVLAFDIGFQLSFLALLGIVYLKPAFEKLLNLNLKSNPGFLSWRENLLTTFSAQVLVAPILIMNFGQFSLTSLLANVLILSAIPFTMSLGFLAAGLSFLSYYLSLFIAWLVLPLLKLEMALITFFAKLAVPLRGEFSLPLALMYYLLIILFFIYVRKLPERVQKA
jgi:competence protein ComEC